MPHDDFAQEPIPGLPEELPEDETILWQGRPQTWALARDALAIRPVAAWFAALAIWRMAVAAESGGLADIAYAASWMVLLGGITCGLLLLTAWVQARETVYTITNKRVAMRIGAALTVTFNLPFRQIENAGVAARRDGTGTLAMELKPTARLNYFICWPHVRPWRMSRTEPALRSIPDIRKVAKIFAEAAETRVAQPELERTPQSNPSPAATVPAE
ncbi:MAG: photosynthetic complex putative assembly protein PuhB [Pseudomonadota bacterium]